MPFIENVWYMAAWEEEIVRQSPLARTIAEIPIVMWYGVDGIPAALVNRCPHRLVPLNLGNVRDGALVCGYHGLAFDRSGKCVENPHGKPTASLGVRSFPCVLKHGIVWVWIGVAAEADEARIPNLSFIDAAPQHGISKGYMPTAAGHQLLADNILDLSHADYLHPDTLGGGSISRSKPRVSQGKDDTVSVRWAALDEAPLPIMRYNLECERADMWTDVLWHPNGVMILTIVATHTGEPPSAGIKTINAHIMTPECSKRTHYFYCNSRNFRTDDKAYNEQRSAALRRAFELEDKPMVEAQQERVGDQDFMALGPALLPIDVGSVMARRVYNKLLRLG